MKSAHITMTHRPIQGLVAFVHAAAMESFGGCTSALHLGLPASFRQLDRNEDQVHPGEGGA